MRIVFFGSSQFAVPSLLALKKAGYRITCVVTQPDRLKGRGMHLEGTAVKQAAQDNKLRIYQPEKINIPDTLSFIRGLSPDLFVVVAYGQILSKTLLSLPEVFAINAHASILPKYRGAAPINWALINGDGSSGVTIIQMAEKMDAGPILMQKQIFIKEEDSYASLSEKLSRLSADLLIGTLKQIKNNEYKLTPQAGTVSFAPKLRKEDGLIKWNTPAKDICNLIKGFAVWPGAFTHHNGKLLKIYKAKISTQEKNNMTYGEVVNVSKSGITVTAKESNLVVEELQIEGKRRMKAEEFILGHKICVGDKLDSAH